MFPGTEKTTWNPNQNIDMNLNKVMLAGNLSRDPEYRTFPNGGGVCKFALATNRYWFDDNGNRQEEVTFVDVDAFGKNAETVSKHCQKGKGVFIEGRLRLDTWQTQAGENRQKLGVVLEKLQFTSPKNAEATPDKPTPTQTTSSTPDPAPAAAASTSDDDVAF